MDFKEPDLEELIQNDLRTEISKILSQSEIEELEAVTRVSRDDLNSKKSPFAPENIGYVMFVCWMTWFYNTLIKIY